MKSIDTIKLKLHELSDELLVLRKQVRRWAAEDQQILAFNEVSASRSEMNADGNVRHIKKQMLEMRGACGDE